MCCQYTPFGCRAHRLTSPSPKGHEQASPAQRIPNCWSKEELTTGHKLHINATVQEYFIINHSPPPFKTVTELLLHTDPFTCYVAISEFKSLFYKSKSDFLQKWWNHVCVHVGNFCPVCRRGEHLKGAEFLEGWHKRLAGIGKVLLPPWREAKAGRASSFPALTSSWGGGPRPPITHGLSNQVLHTYLQISYDNFFPIVRLDKNVLGLSSNMNTLQWLLVYFKELKWSYYWKY